MEHVENTKSRLQRLEDNFSKFETTQTAIITISEIVDIEYDRREEYEMRVYNLVGQAWKIINNFESHNQSVTNTQSTASTSSNQQIVRLPTIELPSFSGNLTEWHAFEDTFLTLIDRSELLNNIQKLCYLKSSLKGEVYHIIQSLETTDINYNIALKLITELFSHYRKIVYSHVNSLLNFENSIIKNVN